RDTGRAAGDRVGGMGPLAADADHLVVEAVARPDDSLRAVPRGVWIGDRSFGPVGRAAPGVVAPPAAHRDALARIAVAIADPAHSPARRPDVPARPRARQRHPQAGVRDGADGDTRLQ